MAGDRESSGGAVLVDPLGGLMLDPSNELRFKGPFDDYVTVSLTIRNPTEKRIAFKIKTTAPKRYCVKPNSGVLDPGQSMKVNVLLQPFNYDPNEKNKHKFMVQYLYLNDQEIQLSVNEILNMWKDVDVKRLLDLKLKCIFDFSENEQPKNGTNSQPNDTTTSNNLSTYSASDTTVQKPSKEQTPAPTASMTTRQAPSRSEVAANTESHSNDLTESTKATQPQQSASTVASSQVNVTPVVSAGTAKSSPAARHSEKNDNLSNELKMVQKENEALKIEVANLREAEIRLRKLVLSSNSSPGKQATSLADLLQNRLVLVIAVLVAIIFYLLLFR